MTKRKRPSEEEIDAIVAAEADQAGAWDAPIHVPGSPWRHYSNLELAGTYYVLSILHRLGATASLLIGPEKSADISLLRAVGDVITIDVKAGNPKRAWTEAEFVSRPKHFIIFVEYPTKASRPTAQPKTYIAHSKVVWQFARKHEGQLTLHDFVSTTSDARDAWHILVPTAEASLAGTERAPN